MTLEDAMNLATAEVNRTRCRVINEPPEAIFKERNMRLGKNRKGWLVVFRMDVPLSFEPNLLHVEVYEPDEEIHIPLLL